MQKGFGIVFLIVGILLVTLLDGGGYYFYQQYQLKQINSFEECAEKYPVMESYPAQCNTPDSRHFVQQLSDEEKKKLIPPTSEPTISDETANWKTYEDKIGRFSLEYSTNLHESGHQEQMFLVKNNATLAEQLSHTDQLVEIRVDKNVSRFKQYYDTADNKWVEGFGDLKIRNSVVDNYKVVEYGYDEAEKGKEIQLNKDAIGSNASVGLTYFNKGLIVDKQGTIIEISTNYYYGDFKATFDKILTTLKFLE